MFSNSIGRMEALVLLLKTFESSKSFSALWTQIFFLYQARNFNQPFLTPAGEKVTVS